MEAATGLGHFDCVPVAVCALMVIPANTARSNDWQALLLTRDFYDKFDIKADYQINRKMSGFLRYSQRIDAEYYQPDLSPGYTAAMP